MGGNPSGGSKAIAQADGFFGSGSWVYPGYHWQPQPEGRAFPQPGIDGNHTVVFFCHNGHERQTEAGAVIS